MKDFQEFRKTIDSATLEKWNQEIRETLISKLDKELNDDPFAWEQAYTQSYAFQTSMRLLEAYHTWLAE